MNATIHVLPTPSVDHAASWKLLKPNFQVHHTTPPTLHYTTNTAFILPQIIFQELVFPLLCYSDKDDELWHDDPYEFIRLKYGKGFTFPKQSYLVVLIHCSTVVVYTWYG